MKMKIKLPASPKPRNPHAMAARQRYAGAHAPEHPQRTDRRKERQRLHGMLNGNRRNDDDG